MWLLTVRQHRSCVVVVDDAGDTPIFPDQITAVQVAQRLGLPRHVALEVSGVGVVSPTPYRADMTFAMAQQEFSSWRKK